MGVDRVNDEGGENEARSESMMSASVVKGSLVSVVFIGLSLLEDAVSVDSAMSMGDESQEEH